MNKNPNNINEALKGINKKYGEGSAIQLDEKSKEALIVEPISTGCFALDRVLGCGGLPRGRIIEIFGQESCIEGNTFIPFQVRNKDGKSQNTKGGTIERLYHRFHKIPIGGSGNFKRKQTLQSCFYVASLNEEGYIFQNKIADVVKCGVKECFKIKTFSGKELICTKDHKLFVGNGKYRALNNLKVDDIVYIHNNTPFRGRKKQARYKEVLVKYHPSEIKKQIEGKYNYCRIKKANIIYEAVLNNLTVEEYVEFLNTKSKTEINKLKFIQKGYSIHHKNLNSLDDNINNLECISHSEHYRKHALSNQNKLSFVAVQDTIKSISYYGEVETYDIKCFAPNNNYIANSMVVHNSGKTAMALFFVKTIQESGGKVVWIDAEHAFSVEQAEHIGVVVEDMIMSQPLTGEQSFDIISDLASTGDIDLIVVDSVSNMTPKKELEGEITDQQPALLARMMSKGLRMTTSSISRTKTVVIFINQIRQKVGQFFGNKDTTTGGLALKFYSSIRLEVKKGKKILEKEDVIGNWMRVKAVKNKVGQPFRELEFELIYLQGIDLEGVIVDQGIERGIITKVGNTLNYKEIKLGVGRDNAKQYLKDHKDVAKTIEKVLSE